MNTTKTKVRSTEEALKLAFDLANMHHTDYGYFELRSKVRQFAKKVLTQPKEPEQRSVSEHLEPVAWDGDCVLGHCGSPAGCEASNCCRADYTTPPQRSSSATPRTWVGLTDDELNEIVGSFDYRYDVAKAVEAKLKAKNERLEKNTHE